MAKLGPIIIKVETDQNSFILYMILTVLLYENEFYIAMGWVLLTLLYRTTKGIIKAIKERKT